MKNLSQLITGFLEYLEIEQGRAQATLANYDFYLRRFCSWAKNPPPEKITGDLIRQYRLWLNRYADPGSGQQLAVKTQNYHLIALRSFLKYLAKRDIKTMAADKIELAKQSPREVEFLEGDELARLLRAPDDDSIRSLRDRSLLEMLFSTGLRVSELCGLNRDSLNLKSGEFAVRGKGDKLRAVFLSERE